MKLTLLILITLLSSNCLPDKSSNALADKPQTVEVPPRGPEIPEDFITKPQPQLSDAVIDKYKATQDLIKNNHKDILSVVANSQPAVKNKMTNYLEICLEENDGTGWLARTGKPQFHLTKFMETVDFFMVKINDAKAFKPNAEQVEKYNQLKSLIIKDKATIEKYINDRSSNLNHTDLSRQRMYRDILNSDFEQYRSNNIVTEKEFEKNFTFLIEKWESLANDLRLHYAMK